MMNKVITTQYSGTCLTCEESFEQGDEVNWEKDVGCWHLNCPAPKRRQSAVRHKQKLQELGIESYEFGKAPTRS